MIGDGPAISDLVPQVFTADSLFTASLGDWISFSIMSAFSGNPEPTIRFASEEDVPLILSLIHELAAYEKAASSVLASEASLLKTLSFPSNPSSGYAKTLLLFAPDPPSTASNLPCPQCAGMALYFTNYSTWRAAPGIYLEDLFVRPGYRGRGYGKTLLQELAKETKRIGGERLEWSVLKWNEPSIKFYKAIGARQMDEWVGMRVDNEALDKMAGSEVAGLRRKEYG